MTRLVFYYVIRNNHQNIAKGGHAMLRKTMIISGAIVSALMGYAVFKLTGLCDACETSLISNILGIIIVSICLYSYAIGLRRPTFESLKAEDKETAGQKKRTSYIYDEMWRGNNILPLREIEYVLQPNISGKSFKAILVDTTKRGLCLKTGNYLEEGQKVVIRNMLPNECDSATVHWVKELEPDIYMTRLNCS